MFVKCLRTRFSMHGYRDEILLNFPQVSLLNISGPQSKWHCCRSRLKISRVSSMLVLLVVESYTIWRLSGLHWHKVCLVKLGLRCRNQRYGRRDPSRWPRGTLYPQKFTLTSPTSGGRSVGIVRSRTQTMEFVCLFLNWKVDFLNSARKLLLCSYIAKTKLCGLSPRANYSDRATAACRRS
jgi:hypothetical protein